MREKHFGRRKFRVAKYLRRENFARQDFYAVKFSIFRGEITDRGYNNIDSGHKHTFPESHCTMSKPIIAA